jgi:hypothetical protein
VNSKYTWAALLTGASLLLFGYDYGVDPNLAQVLPFVNKLMHPALYPGDPFIASFSSFPSLYPHAAALLGRLAPLGPAHFAAYLTARFLFLLVVFALAETLTASRRTAFFAMFLAAVSVQTTLLTPLGEDPLLKTAFFQSTLAGLAGAFALLLFLRKKYLPAFTALGAMLFANGLLAIFLAVLFAAALPGAPDASAMRRGWAALGAIALAWLAWLLLLLPNHFGGPGPEYAAILKLWYPGHYFPTAWSADKWLRIACFVPLNLFFIYSGTELSAEKRTMRAFLYAFGAMWAAAALFGTVLPLPRLVTLQLFRSDAFFCLLGIIFAADFLRWLYSGVEAGGWALGALLALAFMDPSTAVYPLFALALAAARRNGPAWAFRAAAAAGALFCGWHLFQAAGPPDKKYIVLLTMFTLAALAGREYKTTVSPRAGALLALAAVIIPYLPLINYRVSSRSLSNYGADSRDWVEMQRWAAANTPENAKFFVPPDTYGFRVFSLRSPVVEWLDCSAMHWAPGFEKGWEARLADLRAASPNPGAPDLGYSEIPPGGFAALGRKYGAAYVVRRASAPFPFKSLHANPSFTLYNLN